MVEVSGAYAKGNSLLCDRCGTDILVGRDCKYICSYDDDKKIVNEYKCKCGQKIVLKVVFYESVDK